MQALPPLPPPAILAGPGGADPCSHLLPRRSPTASSSPAAAWPRAPTSSSPSHPPRGAPAAEAGRGAATAGRRRRGDGGMTSGGWRRDDGRQGRAR
ncbi:hypothetical protein U9M48_009172 [Paspalum notatum var. saurae]|uniref:Uncharacterized protein n=1 Tax=Paspalum notatum var. saurae TaxID=547442 RepID=A0AAQ3SQQ7_PASNO